MSTAKTPVYVLTYLGQPVRVGSYSTAFISGSPSIYYSESKARAASSGRWVYGKDKRNVLAKEVTLGVKPMFLVEG